MIQVRDRERSMHQVPRIRRTAGQASSLCVAKVRWNRSIGVQTPSVTATGARQHMPALGARISRQTLCQRLIGTLPVGEIELHQLPADRLTKRAVGRVGGRSTPKWHAISPPSANGPNSPQQSLTRAQGPKTAISRACRALFDCLR